jgi:hypothetical protein
VPRSGGSLEDERSGAGVSQCGVEAIADALQLEIALE